MNNQRCLARKIRRKRCTAYFLLDLVARHTCRFTVFPVHVHRSLATTNNFNRTKKLIATAQRKMTIMSISSNASKRVTCRIEK